MTPARRRVFSPIVPLVAISLALAILPWRAADPLQREAPDGGWWQTVARGLARAEYFATATATGLQAPNRAQNLRTCFRVAVPETQSYDQVIKAVGCIVTH